LEGVLTNLRKVKQKEITQTFLNSLAMQKQRQNSIQRKRHSPSTASLTTINIKQELKENQFLLSIFRWSENKISKNRLLLN